SQNSQSSQLFKPQFAIKRDGSFIRSQNFEQVLCDPELFQSRYHELKQLFSNAASSVIRHHTCTRIVRSLLSLPHTAPVHVEADHSVAIKSTGAEFQLNTIAHNSLLKLLLRHLQLDLIVRECQQKALVQRMKVSCGQ